MRPGMSLSMIMNLAVGLALLSACTSVPTSSPEADARAKQFLVDQQQSRIYLYRNELLGSKIQIPVTLDGKLIGYTAPNIFFALDVSPGKHEVGCLGDNNESLSVEAKPGAAVYVWQEMKFGSSKFNCVLHQVEEAKGRKAVKECKLATVLR